MKGILIEIKNNLQGNNSRMDEAENQVNDLEHKESKKPPIRTRRKKKKKKEDRVSNLWDNFKFPNICIIAVSEGEEKEQEIGNLSEKITKENFPNLVKETDIKSRKHRVPNKIDAKRPTPRHIIIKMTKVKDKERIFCKKDFIYLLSERGIGREKERGRNINVWLPLIWPQWGT